LTSSSRNIKAVYPACAGIHLELPEDRSQAVGLPRMRGDPPALIKDIKERGVSTPHARGSTLYKQAGNAVTVVYPACAGIHPS